MKLRNTWLGWLSAIAWAALAQAAPREQAERTDCERYGVPPLFVPGVRG